MFIKQLAKIKSPRRPRPAPPVSGNGVVAESTDLSKDPQTIEKTLIMQIRDELKTETPGKGSKRSPRPEVVAIIPDVKAAITKNRRISQP